jgi:hypothetical protein
MISQRNSRKPILKLSLRLESFLDFNKMKSKRMKLLDYLKKWNYDVYWLLKSKKIKYLAFLLIIINWISIYLHQKFIFFIYFPICFSLLSNYLASATVSYKAIVSISSAFLPYANPNYNFKITLFLWVN